MDFFVVGIVYWLCIGVSILLFIWGLLKKSWESFLWGGIALSLPTISIYLGGAEGWFRWFGVLPLILFAFAYFTKK